MKFRRTVSSVIVSAFLAIVVLLAVLHFHASTYGIEKVKQTVQSFIPQGDHGLNISMDSVDSTLMKGIRINGIHLTCDDGTDALKVGSIDVSLSILKLVGAALGIGKTEAVVTISDVSVLINESSVERLRSFLSDLKGDGDQQKNEGKNPPFSKTNLSVGLKDLSVVVDYSGIKATSNGISATMNIGRGFEFKDAVLNIPGSVVSLDSLGDPFTVNDIRVSIDEDRVAYLSVSDASYGDLLSLSTLSAIAAIQDGNLSVAMYLDEAEVDGQEFGFGADVNGIVASANYSTEDKDLSFHLDVESLEGLSAEPNGRFSAEDLVVAGSFDGNSGLSLNLLSKDIDASLDDYRIASKGIAGDVSLSLGNLSSLGQITLMSMSVGGLESSGIETLELPYLTLDYSYSSSSIGARVRSSISGKSSNDLLRDFSLELDANAQMGEGLKLGSMEVLVDGIHMAALRDSASLSISLDGKGSLSGLVTSSSDFSASFEYGEGDLGINLYLSDFRPFNYKGLYESLLAPLGVLNASSALDGNLVANASFSEQFSEFVSSVLSLSPQSFEGSTSILDCVKSGRLSFNTAVRDLSVGESLRSGAVSFEATMENGVAEIDSLAITTGGLRLSYEGSFELAELIPDGKLSLQNASDGRELASAVFSHARGLRTYEFNLQSPLVGNSYVSGTVDWQNLNSIAAIVDVKTPVLGDSPISVNALLSMSPMNLSLFGDQLSLDVSFEEDVVKAQGAVNNLLLHATDAISVLLSSEIEASYNIKTSEYALALVRFSASLSNGLGLGFDLDFSNRGMRISNVSLLGRAAHHELAGSFDFTFSDIASILRGDTSSLDGYMDFTSKSGTSHLHGSVTDEQFYIDFRFRPERDDNLDVGISVLGQRDNEFYATSVITWGKDNRFGFKAMYDDKVVTVYDSSGRIGSLHVDDINLVVDFASMFLSGSMLLKNENTFKTGEVVTQSAIITLSSKVESIANGLMQVAFGEDYSVDFTMGISDVHLADGYSVEDTTLDVNLSNSTINLSGNIVSGSFDMDSGYLDIEIDKGSLLGFKAQGYLGRELNLLVSDISFPLPILNQFMDSPGFAFRDGLVEGKILIHGTAPNLSLYGMAYCQSYEMTLFYLPDQIISAKNVAVSFNDHVISISRTPMSGYSEADGRYFYGDVAVEIVLQETGFESFDVKLNINENTPIDFWMPVVGDFEFDLRGDVTGFLEFGLSQSSFKFIADIGVSSTLISFRIEEELPSWYRNRSGFQGIGKSMDVDISITTGHDIEFYYPEKDNSFINFTLAEDKTVRMVVKDNEFKMDGGFSLKTGQVYYFRNDFIIREGSVDLTERKYKTTGSDLPIVLNLIADITDYDSDGNKVVISLILQNATLDNISPRFTSTPMKDENEILAMLGQSVLSSSALDRSLSLSSLASFAATATDALTRVGILESNKSYSISGIVRSSLGLDIFSARSKIISNVLIDALPGDYAGKSDVSMLARYLDGTSIFAGKYITTDWFFKIRLMLKAENNINNTNDLGHFLAKDLILDTEISLDWDTPMGTVSIFTNPHELSVFDILDTIGFSVTKQFQF